MTIQYVNTGSSPNKGDGDSLRTAFNKINSNFSQITASLGQSSSIIVSAVPPTTSTQGLLWYDIISGRSFIYYDGTWVDSNPAEMNTSTLAVYWTAVPSNIIPASNLTYDLGSTSSQWRSLYVGTSTIYIGGSALSVIDGNITINGNPVQGNEGPILNDRITSSTYSVILEGTTGTISIPNAIISQGYQLILAGSQSSYDIGRYLRVRDGDFPSHLHLDTADNTLYDIILGDDQKFVRVDHTGTVVIGNNSNTNNWTFNTDGSINFPSLTVNISGEGAQTGQVLQFGDPLQQFIITGPAPSVDTNAQRLIIQGQLGQGQGEGGDIYLLAGDADVDGGDIEINAGDSLSAPSGGGHVNITGGNGYSGGGNVTLTAGDSDQNGGSIILASGSSSIGYHGYIRLTTTGAHNWDFDRDGRLTFPNGGTIGPEGMGWPGFSNGITETPVSIVNKKANGDWFSAITLNNDGTSGTITLSVWDTSTVTSKELTFNNDGSLTFPTMTVPISDNANPSGTGQTLKFNDPSQQAIIYGPPSSDSYNSAERIIIQGAPGYNGTIGEGGDIYLWAGPGGDGGGDGGDIKIRAGRGSTTGSGGYLNFQAGNAGDGVGANGGWINIESGSSANGIGGNITIDANSGGNIDLYTAVAGVIRLNTAGGTKVWTFNEVGALSVPGFIYNNDSSNVGQLLLAGDTGEASSYLALPSDLASTTTEVRLANQNGIVRIIADNNKYWYFNGTGGLELPGGSVLATSGYDVALAAGNDGDSTFGSVTIFTQGPPTVYTVVQQTSPYSPDTITTNISLTPNINSIVAGMTVTGLGITTTTTVSSVSGPDIYGTYSIIINPASETGLNYNETYTFTSAGGVTDRNWEFNSLGELNLPQGGAIQETAVTNELWGTTTTSLTLVPGGATTGTQRLEIYSTGGGEGNHIHITSGDQTQTDLFLGNDTQYFAVSSNGANYIQARPGTDSPSPGNSATSGASVNIYAGNAGDNGGNTSDGASGGDVFIASGISSSGLGGHIFLQSSFGPAGFGSVKLSTNGGSSYLEFDQNDTLTFPIGGSIVFANSATSTITGINSIIFANGTTQSTAYTGIASSGTTITSAAVGYIGMPQNNQTSNYVVDITDQGKHIYCTGTSFTVTIPASTVTNFPIGSAITFIAGPVTTATIVIQTDTMYLGGTGSTGNRTLTPFGIATAVKVDSTSWFISGAGLS